MLAVVSSNSCYRLLVKVHSQRISSNSGFIITMCILQTAPFDPGQQWSSAAFPDRSMPDSLPQNTFTQQEQVRRSQSFN